ncbi:MAG TPA: PHP domain-containing protein, partial [Acidiferrobacteraceae bacterium]|nr:PHP domain-containing protein [Acidiferrobacteraceae bacterium]
MSVPFVHLRVHSEFSLADGIVRLDALVERARSHDMPAVAVTDLVNVFAVVKFYQEAEKAGIKPLIGADLWVAAEGDWTRSSRLLLLCQDLAGYRSLSRLLTRAYTEGQHQGRPMVALEWLRGETAGLIALGGADEGDVGLALIAGQDTRAEQRVRMYQELFGLNYYLELQRTGRPFQEECNQATLL